MALDLPELGRDSAHGGMRPMSVISASRLLDAWERGQRERPVSRALTVLEAAYPGESRQQLAELPIGQRDRRLLELREMLFGPRLAGVASCPACAEQVALDFACGDIRVPENPAPLEGLRLPNSLDLLAGCETKTVAEARAVLLRRCAGEGAKDLDEAELIRRMELADPQARVELRLSCSGCGHQWTSVFDIASYFWRELDSWAKRILREIHTLAWAYGWSERDILALSAWRRQLYVEMVTA